MQPWGPPPPPTPHPLFLNGATLAAGKKPLKEEEERNTGRCEQSRPPSTPLPPSPQLSAHFSPSPQNFGAALKPHRCSMGGGAGVGPAADVPQRGGGGRFGTPVLSFRCQHAEVSNAELRDAAGLGDPPQFCVSPPPPAGGLKTSGDLRAFLQSAICFQEFTAEQS